MAMSIQPGIRVSPNVHYSAKMWKICPIEKQRCPETINNRQLNSSP